MNSGDDDLIKFEAEGALLLPQTKEQMYMENEGARIWYAAYGSGPPVILLHGGLGNSGNWGYQVPALLENGANGGGKTTLLKTICRLLPTRKGSILLSGVDLKDREPHEILSLGLSMVPEGRRIFPSMTVEENLKIGMKYYTKTLEGESPNYEVCFKDTGVLCEYKNLPLRDNEGKIIGVIGVARDVTERKRMENMLRETNQTLLTIIHDSPLAMTVLDSGTWDCQAVESIRRAHIWLDRTRDDWPFPSLHTGR